MIAAGTQDQQAVSVLCLFPCVIDSQLPNLTKVVLKALPLFQAGKLVVAEDVLL